MSRVATIDIGTNTTLLLVAEASSGTISVLEDRATITRLGRGIGKDGGLGQQGIDRTLAALSGYAVLARVHEAPIFAIGTEALRRAPNAAISCVGLRPCWTRRWKSSTANARPR